MTASEAFAEIEAREKRSLRQLARKTTGCQRYPPLVAFRNL